MTLDKPTVHLCPVIHHYSRNMEHFGTLFKALLLLGLFFSCNRPQTKIQMEKANERAAKIEHNKALARKWILDGWNQNRNREIIGEIFSENWVDGNPAFPDQPKGIEGAMYYVDVYRNIFPDIQFTMTHLLAESDQVCFRFTAEATHKGEIMGIAPTGKRVKISGIVIHRVENGKFAESWNEIDLLGIQQQLLAK